MKLPFALMLLMALPLLQGCCGVGAYPNVEQATRIMSRLPRGSSAIEAIRFLERTGFTVDEYSPQPDGGDFAIYARRVTEICIPWSYHVITVTVRLDTALRVRLVYVRERHRMLI